MSTPAEKAAPQSINDLRCTRCKAGVGHGCVTPSGNPCNEPHQARVTAFWAALAKASNTAASTTQAGA